MRARTRISWNWQIFHVISRITTKHAVGIGIQVKSHLSSNCSRVFVVVFVTVLACDPPSMLEGHRWPCVIHLLWCPDFVRPRPSNFQGGSRPSLACVQKCISYSIYTYEYIYIYIHNIHSYMSVTARSNPIQNANVHVYIYVRKCVRSRCKHGPM